MTSKIKLTFLGTGDQIPSKKRNHTSILLNYNEENILIDCGEGTQRQFRQAGLNPGKITRILITHWHGDHVLGLPGLLSTLASSGYNKTLYIYGPDGIKERIEKALDAFSFYKTYKIEVKEVLEGIFFEGKDFSLHAEKMEHGVPALAYSFVKPGTKRIDRDKLKKSSLPNGPLLKELKEGKDVVYEGKKFKAKDFLYEEEDKKISVVLDTRMNERILPFIKNSDIFVCEGTYSKDLAKEAEEHMHMTVSQAAQIAKKSKVKKLILTHIGGRHSKDMKKLKDEAKEIFENTKFARDFDVVEI